MTNTGYGMYVKNKEEPKRLMATATLIYAAWVSVLKILNLLLKGVIVCQEDR